MSSVISKSFDEVQAGIKNGVLTICVIGLGWMGLPTACLFLQAGAKVIGVDVDSRIVELIRKGQSHIDEPGVQGIILEYVGKSFTVTTNTREAVSQSDVVLVIVPTNIDSMRKPDYSAVEKACREIGLALKRGCLVIIECTVGPGVTEGMVRRILEGKSGLKAGVDFCLAYSPIRAMAGNVIKNIQTYSRIVGGFDKKSLENASAVLSAVVQGGIVKVQDLRTAESAKLFENVYRDVNIALASELALFCEKAGLDFFNVREAAITQPYCHLHFPRVGVGGHCIPLNPYFLISEAEDTGVDLRLVKYARRINDSTPRHIVDLVATGLKRCKKNLKRAKVAVLGISYSNDVKEARYSPALKILGLLVREGVKVKVYDPFYSTVEIEEMGYNSAESLEKTIEGVDCILVSTGHKFFKNIDVGEIARLVKKPACIVDGWRIFDASEVESNGLVYLGVGLGW